MLALLNNHIFEYSRLGIFQGGYGGNISTKNPEEISKVERVDISKVDRLIDAIS